MAVAGVEVISSTLVKPCHPIAPSSTSHPYLNSLVPLTLFDIANFDCQVPIFFTFRPSMPDNQTMIDGLAKVLFHYPHLAGRLTTDGQGHPCILLDDSGVRVIQTTVPTTLEDHLPLDIASDLSNLHPPPEAVEELLQVQLNRFACGSVAVGITSHHKVADGLCMTSFFLAWARMVRGLNLSTLPYHDRAAISVPRDPPRCEFPHEMTEFTNKPPQPSMEIDVRDALARVSVHYSKDFIADIRAKALSDGNGSIKRCSAVECVLAHVWKKATLARGLDDDVVTKLRIGVNGRMRIKPQVPMEYFGNLVLWAFPRMKARELLDASYARVVSSIQKAVAEIDDSYFKSFMDFGELMRRRGVAGGELVPSLEESACADLEINSWLGFDLHEFNFGTGGPRAVLAPWLPMDGLTVMAPSCDKEGAVNVFLGLKHEHAAVFRRVSHSLGNMHSRI